MHIRRLAALLLGGWLAVSLAVLLLATQNFRTVDRLLKSPPAGAAQAVQNLGQVQARTLLRHAASEQNRSSSEAWEEVQLIWGGVLLLVMLWGKHRDLRGLLPAVLMLATVAVMHWFLTPEIGRLGRVVDFIPTDQPSPTAPGSGTSTSLTQPRKRSSCFWVPSWRGCCCIAKASLDGGSATSRRP